MCVSSVLKYFFFHQNIVTFDLVYINVWGDTASLWTPSDSEENDRHHDLVYLFHRWLIILHLTFPFKSNDYFCFDNTAEGVRINLADYNTLHNMPSWTEYTLYTEDNRDYGSQWQSNNNKTAFNMGVYHNKISPWEYTAYTDHWEKVQLVRLVGDGVEGYIWEIPDSITMAAEQREVSHSLIKHETTELIIKSFFTRQFKLI